MISFLGRWLRPVIRGERTTIRPFERADVDRWLEWPPHTDPLFADYSPPRLTARQRDDYYRTRVGFSSQWMFAVDDEHGDLVGRISLREVDSRAGTAVLGITFHPQRLNRGYGTDALRAFLRYYFEELRFQALYLDVAAFNTRARHVYEKLGFVEIGRRWGESQPDSAGIFTQPAYESLRDCFRREGGWIRPLMIDMVLRRADYLRLRADA